MIEHLEKIDEIVVEYNSGRWQSTDRLRELLRELTSQVYYLTKYKIQYKNDHNAIRYKHKGSIGSGEILAHEQVPELYHLRYIIRSANDVRSAIIMEISVINKES